MLLGVPGNSSQEAEGSAISCWGTRVEKGRSVDWLVFQIAKGNLTFWDLNEDRDSETMVCWKGEAATLVVCV